MDKCGACKYNGSLIFIRAHLIVLFPLVRIIYTVCIPLMFQHYIWISIRDIVATVTASGRSYYDTDTAAANDRVVITCIPLRAELDTSATVRAAILAVSNPLFGPVLNITACFRGPRSTQTVNPANGAGFRLIISISFPLPRLGLCFWLRVRG